MSSNLSAKQKAKELVSKYYNYVSGWTTLNRPHEPLKAQYEGEDMRLGRAKQCALIAVYEILDVINYNIPSEMYKEYWQEVKTEIEKL